MPNIAAFVNEDMAGALGALVALKATSITVKRGASTLSAQTVRLETLASQRAIVGEGGITVQCDALALGYKNHPPIADTDLQAGDRFVADGVAYEVILVMPAHEDCLQAWLRVRA